MAVKKLAVCPVSITGNPMLLERVLAKYPGASLWQGKRAPGEDELIAFMKGHDGAIVGVHDPITDRVLSALPELRVIGKMAAGCESIDFDAMKKHGVRFGYTFGVNRLAVAELTLSFMIAGLRMVGELNQAMRNGKRPGMHSGNLLTGRVVGLHGCGHIGKEVVRLLKPFGCTLLACDIKDYSDFYREHHVTPVGMDELLARAEVLSLHLPKTKVTRGLYSGQVLSRIRKGAVLVNTCRGEIVDEPALLKVLDNGHLRAACFDVFAIEPATCDALLNHPRMLATPHIGAGADEVRIMMVDAAIRGLEVNELVDPAKYYDN